VQAILFATGEKLPSSSAYERDLNLILFDVTRV